MYTLLLYSDNEQQQKGKNLAITARRPQDCCMGFQHSTDSRRVAVR